VTTAQALLPATEAALTGLVTAAEGLAPDRREQLDAGVARLLTDVTRTIPNQRKGT
jgi:hypothetical protein